MYPVDREAGDKYRETFPQIVDVARAGRYFLARSVRFLAAPLVLAHARALLASAPQGACSAHLTRSASKRGCSQSENRQPAPGRV
jgi:S-adenosyl methyltransferase